MLLVGALIAGLVFGIVAYRWPKRRVRQEVVDSVRSAGLAMLCRKARQESSIELKAKLSSGVLVGAYKEAAELVLRERADM